MSDETENKDSALNYAELCELYGDPRKKGRRKPADPADRSATVYGLTAFAAIAIIYITALLFYSRPVLQMGGETTYGKTVNIFYFIYLQFSQLSNAIKGLTDVSAENISGLFGIPQTIAAGAVSIIYFIAQTIILIIAIVFLAQGKNLKLPPLLISAIVANMWIYIAFGFVCNISGGEGSSYYYAGDLPAPIMTAGMAVAVAASIFCTVFRGVKMKQYYRENGLLKRAANLYITYATGFAIWAILAVLPMSRVFSYTLSGSVASALSAFISNSFSIAGLAFSLLNLLILVLTLSIFNSVNMSMSKSMKKLFSDTLYEPANISTRKNGKKKKPKKEYSPPIMLLISSVLALAAIIILHIPEIGLGWSVNLFPYFIALSAIAAARFTASLIIFKSAKKNQQ